MAFQKGIDRGQSLLFPLSLEEMIASEHPGRIIDLFIQTLDLQKLGFSSTIPTAEGRPTYDPKDLLKLYLYRYLNSIRTSRLLEQECLRNIEVMWLLNGLKPYFRTIASFRSTNSEGLKSQFIVISSFFRFKDVLIVEIIFSVGGSILDRIGFRKNGSFG